MESKRWLTGKEVTEKYGIQVHELGQACYEGKLKAYQADTCKEILEETKITKIPSCFPSNINPRDHKKYGVNIEWEWNWRNEWHQGMYGEDRKHFDIYLPDSDEIVCYNDTKFILFPFLFEDYKKREEENELELLRYDPTRCLVDYDKHIYDTVFLEHLEEKYTQDISKMIFNPADIQSCLIDNGNVLTPVNVSPLLWAGKTPQAVFDALKKNGYDNAVAAYVIRAPLKTQTATQDKKGG